MTKKQDEIKSEELRAAPAWLASRPLLASHGESFFSHWRKTEKSFDEEEIHDLRVASRRLREALALFLPLLNQKKSKKLAKKVKKVTRMLGEIRNTDEAFRFFSELSEEEKARSSDEIEDLLAKLRGEREQAHMKLKEEFAGRDPAPLYAAFQQIQDRRNLFDDSAGDHFTNMVDFATDAIMQRDEPVREQLPQALQEENGAGQHRLRINLKKLRYRLEIISPLLEKDYDELHKGLKDYQDVLGKLHDIDVFKDMVRERVPQTAGRDELFRVMSAKRKEIFSTFLDMLRSFPLDTVGERVQDALRR